MELHIGQQLRTTTNELVEIVDLTSTHIWVQYKEKTYRRPKTIVGKKLFIQHSDYLADDLSKKPSEPPSCKNCAFFKREECFGGKQYCDDYSPAPNISKREQEDWPQYGDATSFRKHQRRVQKHRDY